MLKRNDGTQFDQHLVRRFVQLIGIYPVGQSGALDTGEIAVVLKVYAPDPYRPQVRVLFDRRGKRLDLTVRHQPVGKRRRRASGPTRSSRRSIRPTISWTRWRSCRRRSVASDFTARVLSIVRRIPPGRVATYGDVARRAGRPRAARAVGNIMRSCGRPDVPCHRVIAAGGRLGGYGGREMMKRALLAAEGIAVAGARVRELDRVSWR